MCHVAYVCILVVVVVVVVVVGGIGKHALLHPLHHNSPSWRERERERIFTTSPHHHLPPYCVHQKKTLCHEIFTI